VKAGRFREDLFYRLNVIAVTLPGLRDRPADLEAPGRGRAAVFRVARGQGPGRLLEGRVRGLRDLPWPGNLRELRNVIERAVILAPGDTIELADLPEEFSAPRRRRARGRPRHPRGA
jgi:two-component system, NtrC family, response regulator AlgB